MNGYTLKINGTAHRVTFDSEGNKLYDPPLPGDERVDARFEEMLSNRNPPRCLTDDVFLAGLPTLDEQLDARMLKMFKEQAAKKGVALSGNEHYIPTMAKYFGDPDAIVTHGQARGHIKKVCEKNDWNCDGAVSNEREGPQSDPDDDRVRLSKSIVNRKIQERMATDPEGTAKMDRRDLEADIIEKHGSK